VKHLSYYGWSFSSPCSWNYYRVKTISELQSCLNSWPQRFKSLPTDDKCSETYQANMRDIQRFLSCGTIYQANLFPRTSLAELRVFRAKRRRVFSIDILQLPRWSRTWQTGCECGNVSCLVVLIWPGSIFYWSHSVIWTRALCSLLVLLEVLTY